MSITDIVNRKTGAISGPTASVQDVSAVVSKSLEELVKTKQLASAADAVNALLREDRKEEGANPFSGLKELGFNVGEMIQHSSNQAKIAWDELQKTREQILEEKSKSIEREKHDQSAVNALMQQMMQMQNQSYESQLNMMRQMYDERIKQLEQQDRPPETDPVTQLITNLSVNMLKEKLTHTPPAAQDQIAEAMTLVNTMRDIFASNSSNSNMEQELLRMKLDLESQKLDIEREERAADRLERRQREEARAKTTSELVSQIAQLMPAVVEVLKSRSQPAPAGPPMGMPVGTMGPIVPTGMPVPNGMPPFADPNFQTGGRLDGFNAGAPRQIIENSYHPICPNCGEDIAAVGLNNGACPRCGAMLVAPYPHSSHSANEGGILEI